MTPPRTSSEIASYNRDIDDFNRFLWTEICAPIWPIPENVFQPGLTTAAEETAAENRRLFPQCCLNYQRKVLENKKRRPGKRTVDYQACRLAYMCKL
jgi:hypothetical protein